MVGGCQLAHVGAVLRPYYYGGKSMLDNEQEPQKDHELTAIVMDEVDGEMVTYEMNVFQMVTQALFDAGHLDD